MMCPSRVIPAAREVREPEPTTIPYDAFMLVFLGPGSRSLRLLGRDDSAVIQPSDNMH